MMISVTRSGEFQTPGAFVEAFAGVPNLYIADGHHRAASASRARAQLKEHGFSFIGNEEYNFFQCVIFPDKQLQILPYNRIVRDLNGMSPADFLARVREVFHGYRQRYAVTERAWPVEHVPRRPLVRTGVCRTAHPVLKEWSSHWT